MPRSATKFPQWTLSPQATEDQNLWRDMVICAPLWEGVGQPRCFSLNDPFRLSFANGCDWVLTEEGMGLVFPEITDFGGDTARAISTKGDPPNISSSESYFSIVRLKIGDTSVVQNDFAVQPFVWGEPGVDTFASSINSSGQMFIYTVGANTNGNQTIAIDDNQFHTVITEWDQPGTNVRQWVDGELDYDINYTDTATNTNPFFSFQRIDNTTGDVPRMEMTFCAIFKGRVVNPNIDVYSLLRPAGF